MAKAKSIGLSIINDPKKQRDQLQLVMASSKSMNDLFKQQTWKQPKLMELNKVLYRLLTAICSKGKPVSGPMLTKYAKSVTGNDMLPGGSNKILLISIAYILSDNPEYLIIWHLSVEWVPD